MLEISTFGGLQIVLDGQLTSFPTRKTQALLIYLLVTGQPQAREHLADLFWDDRHPTTVAHQELANSVVFAEPDTSATPQALTGFVSEKSAVSAKTVPEPSILPALGLLGGFLLKLCQSSSSQSSTDRRCKLGEK